ncbi:MULTISPECIES: hypothetical protein [Burkholderia]|uniref:hypothetical protein n=1 Tax=Burkholderia TaxID=32008 RepID=UPI0015822363|nr:MULTISPECIES: hypothetical protein [Burkholderia]
MSTIHDDPTLQPTDAAGFERQIETLREKRDHIGLPGITLAMWPPSVNFSDDVSDPLMFNGRYIEPDFVRGQCSLIMYCFALMHNFSLFIILMGFLKNQGGRDRSHFAGGGCIRVSSVCLWLCISTCGLGGNIAVSAV